MLLCSLAVAVTVVSGNGQLHTSIQRNRLAVPTSTISTKPAAFGVTTTAPLLSVTGGSSLDPTTTVPAKKSSDVLERVGAAVAMVACLALLVKACGDDGIVGLVLVAQVGMYREMCALWVEDRGGGPLRWHRWLWFITAWSATTGSALVATAAAPLALLTHTRLQLVSCLLGALSLVSGVVAMSTVYTAGPEALRFYLGQVAAGLFALTFVVGLPSFLLLTLRTYGGRWLLFSCLLVVTNDTMAYVCGRLVGRTKLLPRLSPNKTVEGFVGAGLSTVAVAVPLLRALTRGGGGDDDVTRHAVLLATFASVVAPCGGFLASAVKRAYGAKDFGTLIPGHGGLVDRLDCQLVMAPLVYVYLRECL